MTADERRSFDEAGYFALPAHLTIARGVLSHLEALFERAGENAGHTFRAEPFTRSVDVARDQFGVFASLTNDGIVLGCVAQLLGPRFELAALRGRSLNPFALALAPPRPGPGAPACRVVWLLDDFAGDGAAALRVIPGSHGSGRPSGELPGMELTGVAGSAFVLHGRLLHNDGANPGNRHLRTLWCEYAPREARASG